MIRQDFARIDSKRRNNVDHRKKQFATPAYQNLEYKHRLNFYVTPPTADITLEQFEQWAIDRLRGALPFTLPSNSALMIYKHSSRRTRSLLLPQPLPRRNSHTHEAPSRQIPASLTHLQFPFPATGAAERPLLALHPPPRIRLHRRSPPAFLARGNYAFPPAISGR